MKCGTDVKVGQLADDDIDPRRGDAGGGRVYAVVTGLMRGLRAVYDMGTVVKANSEVWPSESACDPECARVDIPCHPDQSLTSSTFPIPPSCSLNTRSADFGPFFLLANKPLFSDRDAATMTRSSKINIVRLSSFFLDLLEDGDR